MTAVEKWRNEMKAIYLLGLAALVLGAGLFAGCIDEVVDPTLNFSVLDVMINESSPNPNSIPALNGSHFVYVKVKVNNQNENSDLVIAPVSFFADDNMTEVEGSFLANQSTLRRIDSITVDPKSFKEFWVIFEVPDGTKLIYIRYRGTLDEPIEKKMPDY